MLIYVLSGSGSSVLTGTEAHLLCSLYILDFCLKFYLEKKVLDDLIRRWNFQISFEHILEGVNPRMWESGGLLSMGSHRVGHDWSDLADLAVCYMWESNGHSSQVHILVNSKPTLDLPKVLSSFHCTSSLRALEDLSSKNARRVFAHCILIMCMKYAE